LLACTTALAEDPEPAKAKEAEAQPGSGVPTPEQLLQKAEASVAKLKDYSGLMIKHERFEDGVEKNVMEFKFQKPFKVYVKYRMPHEGREAIYIPGWNDNEVKVHKGSFPDITLNLDPYGGTAMDGNHHPVTHFGLENTIRISAKNMRKALKRGDGEFKVTDAGKMHGKEVWKIDGRFPKGGYFVTAKDDETLWDISKRTGQDMYLIMYTNKDYDDPDDPDEDDKVFIPRYYGGRVEFIVDKKTALPVKITTWDWNGRLYESYEYPEVRLNPGLTRQDFNPENPAYDF
jgi:hypothetical protein